MTRSQVQAILPPAVGCGFVASSAWDRHTASALERRAARQAEFRCGRACAVEALQQVGWCPAATTPTVHNAGSEREPETAEVVGVGPDRRPLWPTGFTGSLSHSRHWTWAVAARQSNYRGIGIDTEAVIEPAVAAELQSEIGRAEEWERLARTRLSRPLLTTLLWSAKEAYFKLWFPLHERFLTWQDVQLWEVAALPADGGVPTATPTEGKMGLTLGLIAAGGDAADKRLGAGERTVVVALWTAQDVFAVATEPAAQAPVFTSRETG